MELKALEALKDEIAHLEEAEKLVEIFKNCFPDYYAFRDFVEKNAKYLTNEEKNRLGSRIDSYFKFDDSE